MTDSGYIETGFGYTFPIHFKLQRLCSVCSSLSLLPLTCRECQITLLFCSDSTVAPSHSKQRPTADTLWLCPLHQLHLLLLQPAPPSPATGNDSLTLLEHYRLTAASRPRIALLSIYNIPLHGATLSSFVQMPTTQAGLC